jgi:hypothetical protein
MRNRRIKRIKSSVRFSVRHTVLLFFSFSFNIFPQFFLFFPFSCTFSFLSRAYRPLFLSTFFHICPYRQFFFVCSRRGHTLHLLFELFAPRKSFHLTVFLSSLAQSLALTSFPSRWTWPWAAPLLPVCFAKNGTSEGPQKTTKGMAGWVMEEEGRKAR